MIKSAIFEPNVMNMSPRSILLLVSFLLVSYTISAQYTEKINSNRPGTSQGAFSVGNNVLQFEGGLGLGKRKHDILNTKTSSFTIDYTARYGLLIEQLEIRANGRFRSDAVKFRVGANEEKLNQTNFELNTLGAKYLIYDPYKRPKEKDSVDLEDLKSWRRTHRFRWKSLIPAVSAYAGVNFDTKDNPFISPGQEGISPKVVIATQNNWNSRLSGDWVLVTNLIFDRIATDDMIIGWIITSTHTINDNWAIFGELQGQKSDFYSDNLLRLGGAYLLNKDLQLDANVAFNFKDTPSVFNFSVGASYRFDWHNKDEIIEQPGLEKGIKDEEKELEDGDQEGDENKDGIELDELEEIESDSLKQGKTPFINDFEDDSFREELEKDLDERRTAERLERERIEAEKLAKKEDKKFQKEERRRLKREAKEARAAEKARIKEEKEKAKMIEDIDAELDKIEQDDGIDDELQKLEEELKKLENEENKDKQPTEEQKAKEAEEKQAKEDQKVDEEYEKLQEEQEKAKKAEEKAKKEEEKRKRKEEKKRQKEEKRRKKEEEKRKKQEDQDQG